MLGPMISNHIIPQMIMATVQWSCVCCNKLPHYSFVFSRFEQERTIGGSSSLFVRNDEESHNDDDIEPVLGHRALVERLMIWAMSQLLW
jgi:hypothetical protein